MDKCVGSLQFRFRICAMLTFLKVVIVLFAIEIVVFKIHCRRLNVSSCERWIIDLGRRAWALVCIASPAVSIIKSDLYGALAWENLDQAKLYCTS